MERWTASVCGARHTENGRNLSSTIGHWRKRDSLIELLHYVYDYAVKAVLEEVDAAGAAIVR